MKNAFLKNRILIYNVYIIFLILFLLVNTAFSQRDTSVAEYKVIAGKYLDSARINLNSKTDNIYDLINNALFFSIKSKNNALISQSYCLLYEVHKIKYQNTKAIDALNNAIFYSLLNLNYKESLDLLVKLSETHRALGNYATAIKYLKIVETYYYYSKSLFVKAKIYNRLSAIYYEMSEYKDAIDYAEKSIILCTDTSFTVLLADNKVLIGSSYCRTYQYQKSVPYLLEAKAIYEKNYPRDLPYVLSNLCQVYANMGEVDKAIECGLMSYNIALKDSTIPYLNISAIYLFNAYQKKGDMNNAYRFLSISNHWSGVMNIDVERQKVLDAEKRQREKQIKTEISDYQKIISQDAKIKELNLLIIILLSSIAILVMSAMIVFIQRARILRSQNKKLIELNDKITQQKNEIMKIVDELHIANASKNKFFSIIAHDIRAPFHSILGLTDILQQDYSILSDNDRVEIISMLNNSSNNLFKLLDNLLKWSQSQTGNIQFKPEKIELKPLIENVVELMQQNAVSKKIKLSFYYTEDLSVFADKNMIDTVVRNLISNAIKFTNTNGCVDVILVRNGNKAKFVVKDNGVGIAKEDLSKIFSIDEKNVSKGTEGEPGTGLGLLLCKEFIEKNKGTIQVESVEGEGSSFSFLLAVAE